jgi:hypothetical protein
MKKPPGPRLDENISRVESEQTGAKGLIFFVGHFLFSSDIIYSLKI